MHFCKRIASDAARGEEGREEEMESRARAERVARKDFARSPKAPKVSREKGTRRREEEVEREE